MGLEKTASRLFKKTKTNKDCKLNKDRTIKKERWEGGERSLHLNQDNLTLCEHLGPLLPGSKVSPWEWALKEEALHPWGQEDLVPWDVTATKEGWALQNDALLFGIPERVQGELRPRCRWGGPPTSSEQHAGSREEGDRWTEQIDWEGRLPLPSPNAQPQHPLHNPMSMQPFLMKRASIQFRIEIVAKIQTELWSGHTKERIVKGLWFCLFTSIVFSGLVGSFREYWWVRPLVKRKRVLCYSQKVCFIEKVWHFIEKVCCPLV